jgi:hypothetical protein
MDLENCKGLEAGGEDLKLWISWYKPWWSVHFWQKGEPRSTSLSPVFWCGFVRWAAWSSELEEYSQDSACYSPCWLPIAQFAQSKRSLGTSNWAELEMRTTGDSLHEGSDTPLENQLPWQKKDLCTSLPETHSSLQVLCVGHCQNKGPTQGWCWGGVCPTEERRRFDQVIHT